MSVYLDSKVKDYKYGNTNKGRYLKLEDAKEYFDLDEELMKKVAIAASASYKLPRIMLIHKKRTEEYLMHLYKVPNSSKVVHKKFVRIGEGVQIYSIGRHRFIEMARNAGAVYKIGDGQAGTVLISLDLFDAYMEKFRKGYEVN